MNKWAAVFAVLAAVHGLQAQTPRDIRLDSVTVRGERPLVDAGMATTRLDSFALRSSPSKSLADVIAGNTPLYVKSYGRGSLATVSFRGTAPSHTPLLWNGMKITSPMIGTADYSLIPSYFIDDARIFHGAGSVAVSGGGFGGAIALDTKPTDVRGLGLRYVQGVGSYRTFDEFLHLWHGTPKLQFSTRLHHVASRNDFRFTNYDKSPGENGRYPVERNRGGSFRDLNVMQEFYYRADSPDRFDAAVWFTGSRRNIPLISTSYREEGRSVNRQYETAVRFSGGWERETERMKLGARVGYSWSRLHYERLEDTGNGDLNPIIDALNTVRTGFGSVSADWSPVRNVMLSGGFSAYLHSVESREDMTREGYDRVRPETSLRLAARWEPFRRLMAGAELRVESYGRNLTPLIYTGFAEVLLSPLANLRLKLSGGRNYRYPTLNDLYYKPGGNPLLTPESGRILEVGLEGGVKRGRFGFTAGVSAYDSRVDDWILWLYTGNNAGAVWTPVNIRRVHSYGVEANARLTAAMGRGWTLRIDGSFGWTPSVNRGEPFGENDVSVGKQLPYVPLYSATAVGRLGWHTWAFTWYFTHYSERFTTTSNEISYRLNNVPAYNMNDISLEKRFLPHWAEISVQLCVNNIFDEEYVTVLSRPMPGINFGVFVGITPKW